MIRFIVREDDATMVAHVGGNVKTTYRTIRMELPSLEHYLLENKEFIQRSFIGIEIEETNANG